MDGGYEYTSSTNRGLRILADAQVLSFDSSEQERHTVVSNVGSPSRRLTTGTNGRGANSAGGFSVKEVQIPVVSVLQTTVVRVVSQMVTTSTSSTAVHGHPASYVG